MSGSHDLSQLSGLEAAAFQVNEKPEIFMIANNNISPITCVYHWAVHRGSGTLYSWLVLKTPGRSSILREENHY